MYRHHWRKVIIINYNEAKIVCTLTQHGKYIPPDGRARHATL